MTDSGSIADRGSQVLFNTYQRQPITITGGSGCWLTGHDGARYLDCLSGIAVNTLGHGHPAITEALVRAAQAPLHVSNLYWSESGVELAERLVEATGMDRVFFCNSGAEAIEATIKLARRAQPGRAKTIVFDRSFHGRTLGALSATAQQAYQQPFAPLLAGFEVLPFGATEPLSAIDHDTAVVLVEPIQGEGGIRPAPPGWLAAVAAACSNVGALLAVDEIQTGIGRSGTFLACQQDGVTPDVVCLAKGLAGGLPIGAVLARGSAATALVPGDHGSTFGGGPFVTTAALAVVDTVLTDGFLPRVAQLGSQLRTLLESVAAASPLVSEVRGRGLMLGLRLQHPVAREVTSAAREQGLLIAPAGAEVIRLLPPLTIDPVELEEAARRLSAALSQVGEYYLSAQPTTSQQPPDLQDATVAHQKVPAANTV